MPLTFAQAQFIVATSAGVAPETLGRLTSRLKQWQKMDFPEGTRGVGKGAKAEYGATQIFQLMLMMKLLKLGVTPDRAKEIISTGWDQFRHGIFRTLLSHAESEGDHHYFFVQLDALNELTTPGSKQMHVAVDCVSHSEISTSWEAVGLVPLKDISSIDDEEEQEAWYRAFLVKTRMVGSLVIEVDSLVYWVWLCFREMGVSPAVFAPELKIWHEEVWRGYEGHQANLDQFFAIRNRSAIETDVGKLDMPALAADALSLVIKESNNGLG